jgi:putative FmdB family regulatory protein
VDVAVYEFECGACGERFELSMPMSQHDQLKREPPACPKCGKTETHQLVSNFSCKVPSGY